MLTVRHLAELPDLSLSVVGGSDGVDNQVTWLHVSELEDPCAWLEGGEFLLTTGLGIGSARAAQRAYLARLAECGLAGLGFGVGFDFDEVPPALVEEADRLSFPVLRVPYEVPFVAITRAAFARLADDQLRQLTEALAVHERLSEAVLEGRGIDSLLGILSNHLRCSLALVDGRGRSIGERHGGRRLPFADALELPVVAREQVATLKAVRASAPFGEYDRLVLHHGQTALAFELSRRGAVSAAELRLAGDLLDDLETERLDDREAARRIAAFGLDPSAEYAALLAVSRNGNGVAGERLREEVAEILDRRSVRYISAARRGRAAFLVEAGDEEGIRALAEGLVEKEPHARVGIGRPARGRALGRSLLEARAALDAGTNDVASYQDLGSLELLLSLPDAALAAFVDRVLGAAARKPVLIESLKALLDTGCRWSEAADRLGVHRHTLRYRMERLQELCGRHPDVPAERMELWLAVKAAQAHAARQHGEAA